MCNVFRLSRMWMGAWSAFGAAFLTLFAGGLLQAQSQRQVSRSISTGANGKVFAGVSAISNPGYHPSRVLVRFREAPAFLVGSGTARAFPGNRNLFLVANPPGL